ncbi:MAG: hypothetical protein JO352_09790 [Chloroflexi bacterium]|nr:hypothetical protein [Chloroflexota bacterium]
MPRPSVPLVHGTTLTYADGGREHTLEVGSSAWYAWLEPASGFTYVSEAGTFTAHAELRERGSRYWRASRWLDGRRRRIYLGKGEGLTLERLAEAAAELAASTPAAAAAGQAPTDSGGAVLGTRAAAPTLQEPAWALTTLPAGVGELLGRQRELALAHELLAGGARLLTLTGPGGVGKTRLALALAAELSEADPDRLVAFADLTPLREAALVPAAIARAFGLAVWDTRVPLAETLGARLSGQRALLVLDNCEQVLDGTRAVGPLLDAVPELAVLATSREPLRLRMEQELPVPPLALPRLGDAETLVHLARNPAVQLFVDRVQKVDPSFQLTEGNAPAVAELCVHLDGLPLALELAAARTKLLPPATLLGRLGRRFDLLQQRALDAPARHQTLRATIAWSYELLSAEEQRVFRSLSVFAGGCSLQAAEAVLGDNVLEVLGALVDKSLIHSHVQRTGAEDEPRFQLLETVRAFAQEQLAAAGERAAVQDRHATYFLVETEREKPLLFGGAHPRRWYDRLEHEHDNLRAALHWAAESGRGELELRLAAASWEFRWTRGHIDEARCALEQALAHADSKASRERGLCLQGSGIFLLAEGRVEMAVARFRNSADVFRATGDRADLVFTLGLLGVNGYERDPSGAIACVTEALDEAHASGDELLIAHASYTAGQLEAIRGDTTAARRLLQRAVEFSQRIPNPVLTAHALHQLTLSWCRDRAGRDALEVGRQSLRLMYQHGDTIGLFWASVGVGCAFGAAGEHRGAARMFGVAERLHRDNGLGSLTGLRKNLYEQSIATARERLGDAVFEAAWTAGLNLPHNEAMSFALQAESTPSVDPTARSDNPLSPREREVATLICHGLTSAEIAERLVITARTADTHADNIRSKLGLRSRTEIASWATARGLTSADPQRA